MIRISVPRIWNAAIGVMAAALSGVVFFYMATSNSNWWPFPATFGYPLTYLKYYGGVSVSPLNPIAAHAQSSILQPFFVPAFAFDVLFGVLVLLCSGYCGYRLSVHCSQAARCGLVAVTLAFVLIFQNLVLFPSPISILVGLLLLFGFPIAWASSIGYCSWIVGRRILGGSWGRLAVPAVAISLIGLGWACWPNDILSQNDPANVPTLIGYLSDPDPQIRVHAIDAMKKYAPFDATTARIIIRTMSDADEMVRSSAISLATDLGPLKSEAIPVLIEDFRQHAGSLFELTQMGPEARVAIPVLKERLPNAEGYTKLGICEALLAIEGRSKLVISALIELLDDEFGPIQRDAASLLGKIGPDAAAAVPRLTAMLNHVPKPDPPPSPAVQQGVPALRQMTEAEFYPQLHSAAEAALKLITRPPQSNTDK